MNQTIASLLTNCFCINLGSRADRRAEVGIVFAEAGLKVERVAAIPARRMRRGQSPSEKGALALALTTRMIIRRAMHQKLDSIVLFEDDLLLHPKFRELSACLTVPEKFDLLYLGALHLTRPTRISQMIVRAKEALDTHAYIIHSRAYKDLLKLLRRPFDSNGEVIPHDILLSGLSSQKKLFAVFPSIAWQQRCLSTIREGGMPNFNYDEQGVQSYHYEFVKGLAAECLLPQAPKNKPSVEHQGLTPLKTSEISFAYLFGNGSLPKHLESWVEFFQNRSFRHKLYVNGNFLEAGELSFRTNAPQVSDDLESDEVLSVLDFQKYLRNSLKAEFSHLLILSKASIPIRSISNFETYCLSSTQSTFLYQAYSESEALPPEDQNLFPLLSDRINYCQSREMLLTRRHCELLVDLDLSSLFGDLISNLDHYVTNALHLAGVDLESEVFNGPLVWGTKTLTPVMMDQIEAPALQHELGSGAFFKESTSSAQNEVSDHSW